MTMDAFLTRRIQNAARDARLPYLQTKYSFHSPRGPPTTGADAMVTFEHIEYKVTLPPRA
jgi:hypothetical protein